MAVTESTHTGDGSTVLFSFAFPYLRSTDIKVTVDTIVETGWSLANESTIEFDVAPADETEIRIYRETDLDAPKAVFYASSPIRAGDLNDNVTQALYAAQESRAATIQALSGDLPDGVITGNLIDWASVGSYMYAIPD